MAERFTVEHVAVDALHDHPDNYRVHPDDQVAHIEASLKEHGFYRNVVIADDDTILAGHGVVRAARQAGMTTLPAIRLPYAATSVEALQVLAGDNEVGRLAEIDDRKLTEILKEIRDVDPLLLVGTGYDEMMLAGLVMVTRPAHEVAGFDEAAEWVGMPDYEPEDAPAKIVLNFEDDATRARFIEEYNLADVLTVTKNGTRSGWWPPRAPHTDSTLKYA